MTAPFDVAGPADAPALVFVHGTRLSRAAWSAQVAGLSGTYRTVALDLPGHGALADEPFTLDAAADRVADAIDVVGGRAVVVGLSLGGYVAMALAARSPERVRGLVLAGATAEPTGVRILGYLGLAWALEHVDRATLDRVNRWFFRARYPAAIADPIIAGGFWPHGGAAALHALVGERFLPRLAAYPGRTLLVNGEYDVFFRQGSKAFARAARDARRVLLRGATHLTNLDRPQAFGEAVRRFEQALPTG